MENQQRKENRKPDADFIAKITSYMRVGADFILASAACELPEAVAKAWQEKAEAAYASGETGIYRDLYEAMRTALAHAEVIALQRLSAEGGAAGAKWLLEKLHPEKYGKIKKQPADKQSPESILGLEEW